MINTAKTLSYDCLFSSLKPSCSVAAWVCMPNYAHFLFRSDSRGIFVLMSTRLAMILVREKRSDDLLN